jgi:anti-sigma regulatory factor (Ser/Thr protein kinase)
VKNMCQTDMVSILVGPPGLSAQDQPAFRWSLQSYLELHSGLGAARLARQHARRVTLDWGLTSLADDAELAVSELVTNAVIAPRPLAGPDTIVLALLADRRRLVIEAWDHSPGDPRPCQPEQDSERGRGLAVVRALTHRSGWDRVAPALKVVWCELLIES